MLKRTRRSFILPVVTLSILCMGGCAKYYVPAVAARPSDPPPNDTARVYFIKPDGKEGGAATFLLKETKLIGYLENRKAMYVDLPPGQHFFMAVASNVDGMLAELRGGRTYYIKLTALPGAVTLSETGTRDMVMAPIVPGSENWDKRNEWLDHVQLVTLDREKGAKWEARKALKNNEQLTRFRHGIQKYNSLSPYQGE